MSHNICCEKKAFCLTPVGTAGLNSRICHVGKPRLIYAQVFLIPDSDIFIIPTRLVLIPIIEMPPVQPKMLDWVSESLRTNPKPCKVDEFFLCSFHRLRTE